MHREGFIIEEIIDYDNMSNAFDQVLRGSSRKQCSEGRYLLAHREEIISELQQEIRDATFHVSGYKVREICEYGKRRVLQIINMRERIGCHAVMEVVDRHLQRRFIRTAGASIKGRGTHDLMKQIRTTLQHRPELRYAYQFDIRHFYDNVSHQLAKGCFAKVFKDQRLLKILGGFTDLLAHSDGKRNVLERTELNTLQNEDILQNESILQNAETLRKSGSNVQRNKGSDVLRGISFGLRSSQGTGNLILSIYLDHPLKDEMAVPFFARYCDDGLVLAETKEELWTIRDFIHRQLESIGFEVKPGERIYPANQGIDIVGYKIYPDHVRLRKRIKKKFARKIKLVKSRKRRRELIASFWGMAKHADCIHLNQKLIGDSYMKSFKDLGVTYKPANGQKYFPGDTTSIRDLVNLTIVVHDFQTGVRTKEGEDRCVVSIEANGQMKKFITNSEEMKNVLSQVGDMENGLPFETTIKAVGFGNGKTKYVFT